MPLHFVTDDAAGVGAGDQVVLTDGEARHAAVVRRIRVGEPVTVGDGRGTWAEAVCESVDPREVVLRITASETVAPASPRILLAQALAKGDRDELAVQAATELGVDAIIPWHARRSVVRWDAAKASKGVARWSTIVREAAKQAHRAWVPEVVTPASTADLVRLAETARIVVLEPTASVRVSHIEWDGGDSDIVLVVGPEGGIDPDELASLEAAGAILARLGDTVLRTSTAGPAALAVLSVSLGRW